MFAKQSVAMIGLVGEVYVHLKKSIMPWLSRNAMPEPLQKNPQTSVSEMSINGNIDGNSIIEPNDFERVSLLRRVSLTIPKAYHSTQQVLELNICACPSFRGGALSSPMAGFQADSLFPRDAPFKPEFSVLRNLSHLRH